MYFRIKLNHQVTEHFHLSGLTDFGCKPVADVMFDHEPGFFLARQTYRPKLALVLSGGAAHGLAHISVLKHLEEINITVYCINGIIIGALMDASMWMVA